MRRALLCLLVAAAVRAQQRPADPIFARQQAVQKARTEGRFAEAAALRDEARAILRVLPADSGPFAGWVSNVASLYQETGRTADARAVVEEALARTAALGDGHPLRIQLLVQLAGLWQADGNLLRAVSCLEKATAAHQSAAPDAGHAAKPAFVFQSGPHAVFALNGYGLFVADPGAAWPQLIENYYELGRPAAVDAALAKLRELAAKQGDARYAWLFERYGSFDEAAAMLRRQVDRADGQQPISSALWSLGELYLREHRYDEAIGLMQQAADSAPAGNYWIRQNLVNALHQAGKDDQAGQVYREMLASASDEDRLQTLLGYCFFLNQTGHAAQGESMLKQYRESHPNLGAMQEVDLLQAMASAEQASGNTPQADDYRRQAEARRVAASAPAPETHLVLADLREAEAAANGGNSDQALRLTLEALDRLPGAPDRDTANWVVAQIADTLAQHRASSAAQQIYDRLFAVAEARAADSPLALLSAIESYLRHLSSRRDRWAEVPAVLNHYRSLQIAAHGADSSGAIAALQLSLSFEDARGATSAALRITRDMVAREEALSGSSSKAYIEALRRLAREQNLDGEPDAAAATFRQRIKIADAGFPAKEMLRGAVRIEAAQFLAGQRQWDEAGRLASEAVAMAGPWPQQLTYYTTVRDQIRKKQ
jgi:hypothetical protein